MSQIIQEAERTHIMGIIEKSLAATKAGNDAEALRITHWNYRVR